MIQPTPVRIALAAMLAVGACQPPDAGRPDVLVQSYLDVVAAEDARPAGGRKLNTLLAGALSSRPEIRAVSVRGLGRLENPDFLTAVASRLSDGSPAVRREAANAVAQAAHRGDGSPALKHLVEAAAHEHDPTVLGVIARSMGRLNLPAAARRDVARHLVSLSRGSQGRGDAPPYQMEGVTLGMLSFVSRGRGTPTPLALRARLREMTRYGLGAPVGDRGAARVRGVAVAAYALGGLLPEEVSTLLDDPAPEVRRVAAGQLGRVPEDQRTDLVDRALEDASAQVRLEGVRQGLASEAFGADACARLLDLSATDEVLHVRLAALDALARPCPLGSAQADALVGVAGTLEGDADHWHQGGHALASLAQLSPARARPLVQTHARHPNPFARMWVARAATSAGVTEVLATLSGDPVPNVRTEAVRGLAALQGREADPALLQALADSDDNQLLLTAAELLEGTEAPRTAAASALDALDRISQARMETLRDARVALLSLVEVTGDTTFIPRVEPYIRDYDRAVAETASRVLGSWTGKRWIAAPRGTTPLPLPTAGEIRTMATATVVLHMARGGAMELRLFPWQAPTNAVRLLRLAQKGALDGLTLHRVVPNFLLQGGSPGANEYAGHGAFTRDEVGLVPNWRGTVGLSTRGRDTGDGQIYLNTVDNVRLDHDYTVYGMVSAGMDVADAVLEGDVIERVEVREAPPR